MAALTLERVTKQYPDGTVAVRDVTLRVEDREFVTLVGPSGCGKSTLLKLVAGLETPTAGTISIGETPVTDLPPRARDVAMVFQSYALYPHLTVYENLAFGLRLRRLRPQEVDTRVREAAAVLGLGDLLDRRPGELSGGQQQRVAMGRAMVRRPRAFLMDEPLSSLDAKLRLHMRAELLRLRTRLGAPILYVTHDQGEALSLGDRVAVMHAGRLHQLDRPLALYERPADLFVAGFIGQPPMNFLEGRLGPFGDGAALIMGEIATPLPAALRPVRPAWLQEPLVVGIRPQDVRLLEGVDAGDMTPCCQLTALVEATEPFGNEIYVHLAPEAPLWATEEERPTFRALLRSGQQVQ
ncbi:MAG: ABC transporter ATP-binding protein, partial [Deltaproteobacteria bacterium]|nr:ABC transporter ATP-binding protein [Deltaproteobacteria bacterium]